MPDKLELVRGWFLKAESDLNTARHMVESDGPYDTACFHAQQAAQWVLSTCRQQRVGNAHGGENCFGIVDAHDVCAAQDGGDYHGGITGQEEERARFARVAAAL